MRGEFTAAIKDMQTESERSRGELLNAIQQSREDFVNAIQQVQTNWQQERADLMVSIEQVETRAAKSQLNANRWMVGTIIAAIGVAVSLTVAIEKLL